jgi:indole-3-glycerol phosphate synthase
MIASGEGDLLAAIVAAARRIVDTRRAECPLQQLEARALARRPSGEGFADALRRPGRVNVIAECKRRSPSKGVLRRAYDAPAIAADYARAGAAAISVLTEPTFFDGDLAHLSAVRDVVSLPLLRKDFIVDRYQVVEARAAGADAILLIVAALAPGALRDLLKDAAGLGLAALVEVHDELELERAIDAGARIIGVNNRNLRTLQVSVGTSERLVSRIPRDRIAVAESGLRTHDDLVRLAGLGYHAFLVGERLMTSDDVGGALRALLTGAAATVEPR